MGHSLNHSLTFSLVLHLCNQQEMALNGVFAFIVYSIRIIAEYLLSQGLTTTTYYRVKRLLEICKYNYKYLHLIKPVNSFLWIFLFSTVIAMFPSTCEDVLVGLYDFETGELLPPPGYLLSDAWVVGPRCAKIIELWTRPGNIIYSPIDVDDPDFDQTLNLFGEAGNTMYNPICIEWTEKSCEIILLSVYTFP